LLCETFVPRDACIRNMVKVAFRDQLSLQAVLASGSVVTMVPGLLLLLRTWSCCGSPWTYLLLWIIAAATPGGLLVGWTGRTTSEKLVGGPVSGFLGTFTATVLAVIVTSATSTARLEIIPLAVLLGGALLSTAGAAGSFLGTVLGLFASRMRLGKRLQEA